MAAFRSRSIGGHPASHQNTRSPSASRARLARRKPPLDGYDLCAVYLSLVAELQQETAKRGVRYMLGEAAILAHPSNVQRLDAYHATGDRYGGCGLMMRVQSAGS